MHMIEKIKDQMVGKSVFSNLTDLLRNNDAEFEDAERRYCAAVKTLRAKLPLDLSPGLDEYLDACKTNIISAVVYAGYLGFRVNLENFHHPIGVDFVHCDTIDYLKGHIMGHFPINDHNANICNSFLNNLPESCKEAYQNVREYFIQLECAGPKLAHYTGYVIGNLLLPWVEPGYRVDQIQTTAFADETKKLMGILPL